MAFADAIETLARVIAWLSVAAIIVLSLMPPSNLPTTGAPRGFEHFIIFVVTGAAFGIDYPNSLLRLAAALVIFAGVLELAQLWAPGRHARASDFLLDAIESCVGLGISWAVVNLLDGFGLNLNRM